ncbi:equilibrative nucleobase transporter 1-like [Scylla paramamosain]|uniref:equilibrative nucleobase transporter 1-like n=1 Tax=Scylla paramamosain TaxID=85552 RepID=UPI0030829800
MECVCSQPSSLGAMSGARRYFVFLVAMAETMLWSGTIFGWASLVHVLKVQGVYSNLCPDHAHTPAHNTTTHTPLSHNKTGVVCGAQDDRMALLYTVACVVYSTPGIFIGYSLHHFGLAFTRVMGGLMVSCGFILLSLTTAATPDYLWGATILLSVGGNTIRMSGLQFGNLFPEGRNTAMAIISGVFTPSAGIMTLLQTMYENGMDWSYICWVFAAASSLVVVATPFIPRHHIPVSMQPVSKEDPDEKKEEGDEVSLRRSIFSLSSLLHAYWVFINLLGVTLFNTHFNTWINRFATTDDEVGLYSRLFGLANILCVLVTPLPGITMDLLTRRFQKGKSGMLAHLASLQAMILPMLFVTMSVTIQTTMLLFRSPWAVYIGLLCLMLNRPSCLAVGNPFVRARFPADHFNRLIGIQSTVLSLFTFIQYPHFTWAQHAYYTTFGLTVAAIALSFSHPLHLLSKSYLKRALPPAPVEV